MYDFNFHLVFVTKYRKVIFTNEALRNDMKAILKQLAYDIHIQIEHLEVMPDHVHMMLSFPPNMTPSDVVKNLTDHVHMMLSFPPNMTPSDVVKNLKGSAARLWFKQHPETKQLLYGGHLWSPSYFMSTIGNVSKDIVASYIESQMQKALKK